MLIIFDDKIILFRSKLFGHVKYSMFFFYIDIKYQAINFHQSKYVFNIKSNCSAHKVPSSERLKRMRMVVGRYTVLFYVMQTGTVHIHKIITLLNW